MMRIMMKMEGMIDEMAADHDNDPPTKHSGYPCRLGGGGKGSNFRLTSDPLTTHTLFPPSLIIKTNPSNHSHPARLLFP